jgi:hypothetical protein
VQVLSRRMLFPEARSGQVLYSFQLSAGETVTYTKLPSE